MAIPLFYQNKKITESQWSSWRWQLTHLIHTGQELQAVTGLSARQATEIDAIINTHYGARADQMRLTPYLASLIDWHNPTDPIALQHVPRLQEKNRDDFRFESVWEQPTDFANDQNRFLQQKYPDIVVLRISNTCHSFCRFCFEKERTLRQDVPTMVGPDQFTAAIAQIKKNKRLRQILVSGGDPLIMPDAVLSERIRSLALITQITTIRINTRTLLHNPFRITPELVKALTAIQQETWQQKSRGVQIYIGVHFNHPKELTIEAVQAIRELQRGNIQIYNQTVLLKGINDQVEILQNLFRRLREENVQLHYLSQAMAVPRTSHFRTSVRRAQALMRSLRRSTEFRGQLPYLELSHHTGKQIIPDTMNEFFYEANVEKNGHRYPIIRFLSDITGQWEEFPDGED